MAIFVVILLLVGVVLYFIFSKGSFSPLGNFAINPTPVSGKNITMTPSPVVLTQNPYETLLAAINKTTSAKTLYVDFKSKVASRLTVAKTGVTQTLHNNLDGYMSGSTDGTTGKTEMRIYSDATPDKMVTIGTINTDSGDWYIKTAATAPKWQKLTKGQYDKTANSQPIDASLFGLNILGTLMAKDKALFTSLKKDSVEKIGDETVVDVLLTKYRIEVSVPDFITALAKDPDRTAKEIEEVKVILKDAVITATFFVDKNSQYIKRITIDAKNLSQVPTPESQQLGISTIHDIVTTADLSRFDLATNIAPPAPADTITSDTIELKK